MNAIRYYSKFGHSKQMAKALEARGIEVCKKSFTCKGAMGPVHKGHPDAKDLEDFKAFASSLIQPE